MMLVGGVTRCQETSAVGRGSRGEGPVQLRPRTEEDASTQSQRRELTQFYKIYGDGKISREGETFD